MPKTKHNAGALKTHLHYAKWVYILIAVGVYFLGDMAYTMTAYRSPPERKVDFQIVGNYINVEPLQQIVDGILEGAAQVDPTLEEINVYNIAYSGDANVDYNGAQKFTVMIAAREGDIYIMNRALTEQMAGQGALLPLGPYIEAGLIRTEGLDLSEGTFAEPAASEEEAPSGIEHVYGIPVSNLARLRDADIGYDPGDACMVLMAYSTNPETSLLVAQRFMDALREPAPETEDPQDAVEASL